MPNRSAALLNDLLEVARDGERFYREAADKVATPELRGTFRQMAEVRQRLMNDLVEHVAARGERPSDDRTLWGKSRRAYAGVLASLSPANESVYLSEFEAMENRLLERYEKALARADSDSVRQILHRHLLTVRAAHDRMKALKDQSLPA
jgi:uncharacterized protein (TIGR02284 family)